MFQVVSLGSGNAYPDKALSNLSVSRSYEVVNGVIISKHWIVAATWHGFRPA